MSVSVISTLKQKNDANFQIADDIDIAGGTAVVGSFSDLATLKSATKKAGMTRKTLDTGIVWELADDLSTWNDVDSSEAYAVRSLYDAIPKSQRAALKAGTSTFDVAPYVNAAVASYPHWTIPLGKWGFGSTLWLKYPGVVMKGLGYQNQESLTDPIGRPNPAPRWFVLPGFAGNELVLMMAPVTSGSTSPDYTTTNAIQDVQFGGVLLIGDPLQSVHGLHGVRWQGCNVWGTKAQGFGGAGQYYDGIWNSTIDKMFSRECNQMGGYAATVITGANRNCSNIDAYACTHSESCQIQLWFKDSAGSVDSYRAHGLLVEGCPPATATASTTHTGQLVVDNANRCFLYGGFYTANSSARGSDALEGGVGPNPITRNVPAILLGRDSMFNSLEDLKFSTGRIIAASDNGTHACIGYGSGSYTTPGGAVNLLGVKSVAFSDMAGIGGSPRWKFDDVDRGRHVWMMGDCGIIASNEDLRDANDVCSGLLWNQDGTGMRIGRWQGGLISEVTNLEASGPLKLKVTNASFQRLIGLTLDPDTLVARFDDFYAAFPHGLSLPFGDADPLIIDANGTITVTAAAHRVSYDAGSNSATGRPPGTVLQINGMNPYGWLLLSSFDNALDITILDSSGSNVGHNIHINGDALLGRTADKILLLNRADSIEEITRAINNPLSGSATGINPPLMYPGSTYTTTGTMTGVVLGDFVHRQSASIDLAGIDLKVEVSAADTVRIRYTYPPLTATEASALTGTHTFAAQSAGVPSSFAKTFTGLPNVTVDDVVQVTINEALGLTMAAQVTTASTTGNSDGVVTVTSYNQTASSTAWTSTTRMSIKVTPARDQTINLGSHTVYYRGEKR